MSYAELLECDKDKVKLLHKRVSCMMHKLNELPENRLVHSEQYTHEQFAYDLYQLSHTIRWFDNQDLGPTWWILKETTFPFESLEELELKLTIRGY